MRRTVVLLLASLLALTSIAKPNERVTVFIDLNSSTLELDSAKKASERLGNPFISLPEESVTRRLGAYQPGLYRLMDLLKAAYLRGDAAASDALEKTYGTEYERYERAADAIGFDLTAELEKLAARLEKRHATIGAFVISGHHSGGQFYGALNGLSDIELRDWIRRHPAIFQGTDVVALWGCAGVTSSEIADWRMMIPGLPVIGGFYGTAPGGVRPDSGAFLADLLLNAELLPREPTKERLLSRIHSLDAISRMFTAVAVRTTGGADWLYYNDETRAKSGAIVPQERFINLSDEIRCTEFMQRHYADDMKTVGQYYSGKSALPNEASDPDLKLAYFDLLQNRDCYSPKPGAGAYAPVQAGLLRFYESGFKRNFARAYGDLLDPASGELSALDLVSFRAALGAAGAHAYGDPADALAKTDAQIATRRERLQRLGTDPVSAAKASRDWRTLADAVDQAFQAMPARARRRFADAHAERDYPAILRIAPTLRSGLMRLSSAYVEKADRLVRTEPQLIADARIEIASLKGELAGLESARATFEAFSRDLAAQIDRSLSDLSKAKAWLGGRSLRDALVAADRPKMIEIASLLRTLFDASNPLHAAAAASLPNLKRAAAAIDAVLDRIDPNCVEMLEWHEYRPSQPVAVKCAF